MSEHWNPDDVVRLSWHGVGHPRRGRGLRFYWLLAAVVVAGLLLGFFLAPTRTADVVAGTPTSMDTQTADVVDDADLAWEQRSAGTAGASDAPSEAFSKAPAEAPSVRVSFGACKWGGGSNCVVDGDTIYLAGEKIRIAGIDAPETHDYGCASELALGERSAARLRELVNSGALTLTSIDRDEDRYGRKLRNVAVDGRDVGAVLVSEGLAREYGGGRQPWCAA